MGDTEQGSSSPRGLLLLLLLLLFLFPVQALQLLLYLFRDLHFQKVLHAWARLVPDQHLVRGRGEEGGWTPTPPYHLPHKGDTQPALIPPCHKEVTQSQPRHIPDPHPRLGSPSGHLLDPYPLSYSRDTGTQTHPTEVTPVQTSHTSEPTQTHP